MTLRQFKLLLESISNTISDYQLTGAIQISPGHVNEWVRQFDKDNRLQILHEMDFVLRKSYFSKSRLERIITELIQDLTSPNKVTRYDQNFLDSAHFLNIQKQGESQEHMLWLIRKKVRIKNKPQPINFIYVDDIIFTGNRIITDLCEWIQNSDAKNISIHIFCIIIHLSAHEKIKNKLKKLAHDRNISLNFWSKYSINNLSNQTNHEANLWPHLIPYNKYVDEFINFIPDINHYFRNRTPSTQLLFSSETGRQLLEEQLLLKSLEVWSGLKKENKKLLRPLGYSNYGFGFGSMFVTYRNCPNTCPLILWSGDGTNDNKWYPLFSRKPYN